MESAEHDYSYCGVEVVYILGVSPVGPNPSNYLPKSGLYLHLLMRTPRFRVPVTSPVSREAGVYTQLAKPFLFPLYHTHSIQGGGPDRVSAGECRPVRGWSLQKSDQGFLSAPNFLCAPAGS